MRVRRPLPRSLAFVPIALMLAALSGCGVVQEPDARITGVQLQDVRPTDATMLFDIEVENPNAFSLPLGNVDYALSSQGRRFLNGKADVQGTVPAAGRKSLGVPVRISFVELVETVSQARPGAEIPYTADLGLSVDLPALGPVRVPMSREGTLSIPSASGLLERLRELAE